MVYFSLTTMEPMMSPLSSTSATSAPSARPSAVAWSVDRVIGIGQNTPLASAMLSHTPCQSAWPMNPSSGVKPPMPSMIRSPRSRELRVIFGNASAAASALSRSAPSSNRMFSVSLPWGFTNCDMFTP